MQGPAVRAGPGVVVGVERLEQRWQIVDDRHQLDLDPVDQVVALLAVPLEPVDLALGPGVLDDEADAWRARYFDPADLPPLAAQDGLAATDRRYGSGEKLPWQEATFDLKDVEAVDTYARAYSYFTGVGEPFVPLTESRELMRVLVACRADAVDNVK